MALPSSPPPSGSVSPILPKPISGLIIASDFEWKSHEELCAMVEHADVERTTLMAARLASAAALITLLGDELKGHVSQVRWEGEAGEAFRTWGADMANATLRLGQLSGSAGEWMAHAASTLSKVKSAMPKPSASDRSTLDSYRQATGHVGKVSSSPLVAPQSGGLRSSGPSQHQAYEAQQRLDADRAEAARLMRQLAESYAWSAHQLSVAPRPTFRPMPPLIPGGGRIESEHIPAPESNAQPGYARAEMPVTQLPGGPQRVGDGLASGSGQHVNHAPRTAVVNDEGLPFTDTAAVTPVRHEQRPAAMEVAGVPALPQAPTAPASSAAVPPVLGDAPGPVPATSLPDILPVGPTGGVPFGTGRGTNTPTGPRSGPFSGIPGRGIGGAPVSRMPDDGVIGGRPVARPPGQSPTPTSLPRGTVIGEAVQGRPQTGFSPGVGAMPGAPAGPGGGSSTGSGRRLATERGGIVGGRRQGAEGTGDRAFTPGGTGLVRGPGEPAPARGAHNKQQRQRPEYVTEDEGAWLQGSRRVVPPVID